MFMSKDNMAGICTALYSRIAEDPRLKEAADLQDLPLKPLVYDIMQGIAEDPEFADAETDEKNRVVVVFGERMYWNHVQASTPSEEGRTTMQTDELPAELQSVKEGAMETTSIEERMRDITNQVVMPPRPMAIQGPGAHTHTEYLSLDSGDRDPALQPRRYDYSVKLDPLRSVATLRAWSATVPMRPNDPEIMSVRVNVSHVWLCLKEVSGSYSKNASDVARRAFCKLVVKACHDPTHGRGYVVYEPVMQDSRTFEPPLASLSTLTVSLRRPDGSLLDGSRDEFMVTGVHKNSDAAANWVLTMNRYWEDSSFMEGDVLRLSEIDAGFVELNAFLNRSEGHVVLAVGYPVGTSFRTVVVRKPGEVDQGTGIFEGDTTIHDQLSSASSLSGRVMNMSMQVSVSMSADCEVDRRHVDPTFALG
jgi:hypothetical protein